MLPSALFELAQLADETGSSDGAAGVLFSMTSTAKRHGLDPFAWLREVLTQLPALNSPTDHQLLHMLPP